MQYKQKSISFASAKLRAHSQLIELTHNDVAQLKVSQSLHALPIEVLQALLDQHPLPVTISADKDSYLTLAPSGIFERFKTHPLQAKLTLRLLIYPHEAVDKVLAITLLYAPALALSVKASLSKNLQHRLMCFEAQGMSPPNKKILASVANTSPSTFRKDKESV
tara:strand:- start:1846 stop:2337 length:492 start_codon:yes stop_codon:yes gene_type:complete